MTTTTTVVTQTQYPIPSHFDPKKAEGVWRVDYATRAVEAKAWAKKYNIKPAATDKFKICFLPIDCQNTFCQPDFELYVGGRSGRGATDDCIRISEFIYRELGNITEIDPTMDTHTAMQIFHPIFLVNELGEHPIGNQTIITLQDVLDGKWKVNPAVAHSVSEGNYMGLQRHFVHYVEQLTKGGKYPLMIWTYHAMLGGIGHALVSIVEEAFFFHNIARASQTGFEIKGGKPLTENYSVLRPEVLTTFNGTPIASKNEKFIKKLFTFDAIIGGGEAGSHCWAWTIDDLLTEIDAVDHALAKKVYLPRDLTSAVVIKGVVDFTDDMNRAFDRFDHAGMNIVDSKTPIAQWPGIRLQ